MCAALDTGLSHLERFSLLDHYQDLFDPKSQKNSNIKIAVPIQTKRTIWKIEKHHTKWHLKKINMNFPDILFPDKRWQWQQKGLRATNRIMISKKPPTFLVFKIPEFLAHLVNLHKTS